MKKVTVKSLYRETEKYLDQKVIINGWVKKDKRPKELWIY